MSLTNNDPMWDRIRESSFKELPAYFDRIPWIFRKLTGQRLDFWGVRPPGWKEWLGKYSPAQVIALQWANSISIAYERFGEMPESSGIIVHYICPVRIHFVPYSGHSYICR